MSEDKAQYDAIAAAIGAAPDPVAAVERLLIEGGVTPEDLALARLAGETYARAVSDPARPRGGGGTNPQLC